VRTLSSHKPGGAGVAVRNAGCAGTYSDEAAVSPGRNGIPQTRVTLPSMWARRFATLSVSIWSLSCP
jgi:hypothetical protein